MGKDPISSEDYQIGSKYQKFNLLSNRVVLQ